MPPTNAPQDRKPRKTASRRTSPEPTRIEVGSSEDKYSATSWGSQVGAAEDLLMPSGQLALVKRPGIEGLIKTGVLNDLDSLTAIVESKHMGSQRETAKNLMQDVGAIESLIHAVDRVVCNVVVKPQVFMTPNDITSRKDGIVYADMIDLQDKMHIFQFAVGGLEYLERFRQQSEAPVGNLESRENVSRPTE